MFSSSFFPQGNFRRHLSLKNVFVIIFFSRKLASSFFPKETFVFIFCSRKLSSLYFPPFPRPMIFWVKESYRKLSSYQAKLCSLSLSIRVFLNMLYIYPKLLDHCTGWYIHGSWQILIARYSGRSDIEVQIGFFSLFYLTSFSFASELSLLWSYK